MLVLGCQCEVLQLNSPYCFLLKWLLLAPAASLLPLLCSPCFTRAVVPLQAIAFLFCIFFLLIAALCFCISITQRMQTGGAGHCWKKLNRLGRRCLQQPNHASGLPWTVLGWQIWPVVSDVSSWESGRSREKTSLNVCRVTVNVVTQDTQESQALGVTDVKFMYCCLLWCVQVVRNMVSHISVVTI